MKRVLAGNSDCMKEENLSLLIQVISLLPNAVHIKSSDHVWIEVNTAFADIMGYSRDDLIGKTSFDVMPPSEAKRTVAFGDKGSCNLPRKYGQRYSQSNEDNCGYGWRAPQNTARSSSV